MGGSVGTPRSPANQASPEYFAFKVLQGEYDRAKDMENSAMDDWSCSNTIPTDEPYYYQRMSTIYDTALKEFGKPIFECKCPAVILYLYFKLTKEEKEEFHHSIIESAIRKEKATTNKLAENSKAADYSQSFGGTAADTKNEKEAAALLRGDTNEQDEEEQNTLYPFLARPSIENKYDQQQLRMHGKWGKYLGGTGCFLYIHFLTKEVVSNRPDDYSEEIEKDNDSDGPPTTLKDPANGLRRVDLVDLQAEVERVVSEGKKTVLLLDASGTGAVRTFYTYKGLLEDVSSMTVPFGKSGIKKEDIMERCRVRLVSAIKTGATFALYMGDVRIEHADFKTKLCKKETFPKEVFQCSGAKLLQPDYDPRFKAIFREADLESGQAVARDGFRVVVISTLDPYEYEEALSDCIPLGYMEVIYVNPPDCSGK